MQEKEVSKDLSLGLPFSGFMQDESKNISKWRMLKWGYYEEDRTDFCLEQTENLLLSILGRELLQFIQLQYRWSIWT